MLTTNVVGVVLIEIVLASVGVAQPKAPSVDWPAVGTQLTPMPDPARASDTVARRKPELGGEVCPRRLRDRRTGREYALSGSRSERRVTRDSAASTVTTASTLTRALGEYRPADRTADTTVGALTVDCTTDRVVASPRRD